MKRILVAAVMLWSGGGAYAAPAIESLQASMAEANIPMAAVPSPVVVYGKGSQKLIPLADAVYSLPSDKLVVSGTAAGKAVHEEVSILKVGGRVKGVNCAGLYNPCFGSLRRGTGQAMLLDVFVDKDQDGNVDLSVKGIPVGSVAGSAVRFSVPASAVFVEERYSFLEHAAGAADKSFVSLTLTVSAD